MNHESDEWMKHKTNMTSRWLLILGLVAAISAAVWMTLPDAPGSTSTGAFAGDFQLPDLKKEMQSLPKGDVVLLNFWATWCPPCRQEIPSMAALHDKYAADGLKIIAISVDKRSSDLAKFVEEYRMPFQVLHDADGAVARHYGVFRYPESFIIDRDGKISHHLVGAVEWMSPTVTKTIEEMLNNIPSQLMDGNPIDKGEALEKCRNSIKANAQFPSSVDIHLITGTRIEVSSNGTSIVTMDFDAKNGLGNELPYTARCMIPPNGKMSPIVVTNR